MKQLAIKIAKQMAKEPAEILQTAAESLTPSKPVSETETPKFQPPVLEPEKEKVSQKDLRFVQALEQEIKEIGKNKLLQDLQARIENGEVIVLENIATLTPAEKQVLQAQMQVVKQRKMTPSPGEMVSTAKRGRRMVGLGRKQAAEKQTTRVERPLPPSG